MGWNPFKDDSQARAQAAQDAELARRAAEAKARAPISIDQTPDSEVEMIRRRMLEAFTDPRKGRGGANLLGSRPFDDTAYQRATLG